MTKLPRPARDRVLDAIRDLADDPRPHGARKPVGTDAAWRIRVGDHRVIDEVVDAALTTTVIPVTHRREVYDRWLRLRERAAAEPRPGGGDLPWWTVLSQRTPRPRPRSVS